MAICVPLIAAHHRGYTKLTAKDHREVPQRVEVIGNLLFGKKKFQQYCEPLKSRYDNEKKVFNFKDINILVITALLRFIDGCDVQETRIISQDYLDYRNQRSDDEALMLDAQLLSVEEFLQNSSILRQLEEFRGKRDEESVREVCNVLYPMIFEELQNLRNTYSSWRIAQRKEMSRFMALSMANRIAFKIEQYLHFRKHRHISSVQPVQVEDNNVIVKITPKEGTVEEKRKSILDGVKDDIIKEYDAVKYIFANKLVFDVGIEGEGERERHEHEHPEERRDR